MSELGRIHTDSLNNPATQIIQTEKYSESGYIKVAG